MNDEQKPDLSLEQIRATIPEQHRGARLTQLTAPSGESVVVRMPSRVEFKRFNVHGADETRRFDAGEELVRTCVVSPDNAALKRMIDDAPGLTLTFLKGILEFAGASPTVEKKAL